MGVILSLPDVFQSRRYRNDIAKGQEACCSAGAAVINFRTAKPFDIIVPRSLLAPCRRGD
jgi:hypothetical protein